MALAYYPKNLDVWALDALRDAGYDVKRVLRVYQPKDADDGDFAEILFVERPNRACTAFMEPSGRVVVTITGFG